MPYPESGQCNLLFSVFLKLCFHSLSAGLISNNSLFSLSFQRRFLCCCMYLFILKYVCGILNFFSSVRLRRVWLRRVLKPTCYFQRSINVAHSFSIFCDISKKKLTKYLPKNGSNFLGVRSKESLKLDTTHRTSMLEVQQKTRKKFKICVSSLFRIRICFLSLLSLRRWLSFYTLLLSPCDYLHVVVVNKLLGS